MGKLGQLLVARGWINLQQLTRALQNQSVAGGRLGTCLLEGDALGEPQLQRGLSEQFGVPAVEIDDLRGIPEEVLALIPTRLARRCRALPFRVEGGRLDLAMMDPRNLSCQDEIAFATSKRVKVYVLHEIRLMEALERYYGEECPSRYGLILDRLNRARYLWQTPESRSVEPVAPKQPSPVEQLFGPAPKIRLPPPLPDLTPPPIAPAAVAPPSRMAGAPAIPPAAVGIAANAATKPMPVPAGAKPKDPDTQPLPGPKPPKPKAILLTPEERAELAPAQAPQAEREAAPQGVPQVRPVREAGPLGVAGPQEVAARAEAPPPRMEPPPRPASAAPRGLASPQSEGEALAALATAGDLEEVGQNLLAFLALRYRRVALFRITRDRIQGWMIRGTGIDQDAFGNFALGFDQPSLFLNLRQGSGLHVGPLPPMPAHRQLARLWGGDLPRDCVMLPIRLRDRLVTVLYADGPPKGASGIDLPQLQRLGAALVAAFERCAVAKKRRGGAA